MAQRWGLLLTVFAFASILGAQASPQEQAALQEDGALSAEEVHRELNWNIQFADQLKVVAEDDVIILSQTSCAYLAFAANWINSAEKLGITNFLIIAEDEASLAWLKSRVPNNVVGADKLTKTSLPESGSDVANWGSKQFATFTCIRPTYIQRILAEGYTVLWSDMDTVWHKNPMEHLPTLYEFVGVDDQEFAYYSYYNEQQTNYTCTCFLYLQNTQRVNQLMQAWRDTCEAGGHKDDQFAFQSVFSGKAREELEYYIMPRNLFPTGELSDIEAAASEVVSAYMQNAGTGWTAPVWSHANYRVGKIAKRDFFSTKGSWSVTAAEELPVCAALPDEVVKAPKHLQLPTSRRLADVTSYGPTPYGGYYGSYAPAPTPYGYYAPGPAPYTAVTTKSKNLFGRR